MSIPWILLEILLNGFDAAYIMSIVSKKAGLKSWVKKSHILIFWFCLVVAYCIINFTTQFNLISMYLFPAVSLVFVFWFVQGNYSIRIFWTIFPYTMVMFCELFLLSLFMYIYKLSLENVIQQGTYRLIWVISCKTLESIIWFCLLKRKEINLSFNLKYLRSFIFISFFSLIVIGFLYLFGLMNIIHNGGFTSTIANGTLLTFICFLLFFNFLYKKSTDKNQELIRQNHTLKTTYHAELIKAYKAVRQSRYDILQHLQTVWSASKTQKPTEMQKYAEAFEQINQQLQVNYDSGDDLVDVIVAVKESEAFHFGIAFYLNGKLPAVHSIQSEDICIITDHILSQALGELTSITNFDSDMAKVLILSFVEEEGGVSICTENPNCGDEYEMTMEKIQDIVDRYQGSIVIENEAFYRTIMITLQYPSFLKNKTEVQYEKKFNWLSSFHGAGGK